MNAVIEAATLVTLPFFAVALWRVFGRIAQGMDLTRTQLLALIVTFGWLAG